MGNVLDRPEGDGGESVIDEAEALIAKGASARLAPDARLAYWGYLRRWREHLREGLLFESLSQAREPLVSILRADRDRRELLVLRRKRRDDPEYIAALAGVNRFLLLEPDDDRLPSWAKDKDDG